MKRPLISLILFSGLASPLSAQTLGSIAQGGKVDDTATVCMSVGLAAALTGLDNITLLPENGGISGNAGTRYSGSDSFHLSSNGRVIVLIDSPGLKNGAYTLATAQDIDGQAERLTTAGDSHDADHVLHMSTRLGAISRQKAGQYTGVVTLTVTPEIGGLAGCGDATNYYPRKEAWSILAWEDLYPSAGDKDYNDMVVAMRIAEDYNSEQQLKHISMDFIPVARGAGYDHSLLLSLDGTVDNSRNITTKTAPVFYGDAQISLTRENTRTGASTTTMYTASQNIPIFDNTRTAAGGAYVNVYPGQTWTDAPTVTHLNIDIADPILNPGDRGLLAGQFLYRPFLHVLNTGMDIDLYQLNPNDRMKTSDGYPFGLLVPTEWAWPAERVSIDAAYPYFKDYRLWLTGKSATLSDQALNWFDYPAPNPALVIPPDIQSLTY